ncbi:MAG TPA: hypothetical protein VLK32_00310 [Bacillota bacterium]|nr:hypothetical protein [Bacillota bacterium]
MSPSLAHHHHGVNLKLDYRPAVSFFRDMRLLSDRTRWVNWDRYSNRQDAAMSFGGLICRVGHEGGLRLLPELVIVASLAHIGKSATFGPGKLTCFSPDFASE